MARKGAFSDQLGDIDELLPMVAPVAGIQDTAADQEENQAAGETAATAPADEPPPPQPASPQLTRSTDVPSAPRRRRAGASPPSVQIDTQVHKMLRRLTHNESAKNPATARTYAQVVLDAIEAHADTLSGRWQQTASASTGLFTRQKPTVSKRRRHIEPPMRIPLAGTNPDDLATMDGLVTQWGAGSRSDLVEEALRLYLPTQLKKK